MVSAQRISALVVDATRPAITLGFLAGKAFLVYISNVYDNLPTDEVACVARRYPRGCHGPPSARP